MTNKDLASTRKNQEGANAPPPENRSTNLQIWLHRHPELAAVFGWVVMLVVFAFIAPTLFNVDSLGNVITVVAEMGIVAIGITPLMICGEIDLSVGAVLGTSAMLFAVTIKSGLPPVLSFVLAVAFGGILGAFNGIITIRTRIPSFIATLGTMMIWRGLLVGFTGGFPVYEERNIRFFDMLNGLVIHQFRASTLWLFALAIIIHTVLVRTPFGTAIFATGGNKTAAMMLGIRTNRVKLIAFVFVGLTAALAGTIQFARFHSVDPLRGQGLELEVIAAAVIGGTLFTGGAGTVLGTLFGTLLVGMVRSGLAHAGAPAYWYETFVGVILILAVVLNTKLKETVLR
jgi:simple sugar transport system permease protein